MNRIHLGVTSIMAKKSYSKMKHWPKVLGFYSELQRRLTAMNSGNTGFFTNEISDLQRMQSAANTARTGKAKPVVKVQSRTRNLPKSASNYPSGASLLTRRIPGATLTGANSASRKLG